jgi:hypothetical protein
LRKARNSPENKERLAKLRALADKTDAEMDTTGKIFDPVHLMRRAGEIQETEHPQLGKIRFGELTLEDSEVLRKCKTDADKTAMALYLMLKKAYPEMPTFSPQNINGFYKAFPMVEGAALLKFVIEQPAFLSQESGTGSAAVEKRKKSD